MNENKMLCLNMKRSDLMNIRLPENYFYAARGPNDYAYVANGTLYVEGYVNFEHLMYNLSYTLNGYGRCHYCGCTLTSSNRTLDHVHPRSWGGISLPDNLVPCCRSCNNEKTDMTPEQYEKFKKIRKSDKEHAFYYQCIIENTNFMKSKKFLLPEDWVTMYDASKLIEALSFRFLEKSKMEKLEDYFKRVKQYPHPIVVSSNGWLFKGKHILYHARKIHRPVVPAIVLENVEVIMKSS